MFNFFSSKKEIIPEVLIALRWKFPDKVNVEVRKSEDGGYFAIVKNLPGCITQAEKGQELFEMVNDAIYTYLDVPPQYIPHMPAFLPPEEIRKKLNNIEIPEFILQEGIVLQRT